MFNPKRQLINFLKFLPGTHTRRKIVVFESDDWGSIRMPSLSAYDALLKAGIPVDKSRYNRFDTLASRKDLSALFEVLTSVKDCKGNHAKFTPMSLVANPDFGKIRANDFQHYFYETLPVTWARYGQGYDNILELWQEGIQIGIFVPQFHGREHLNVYAWLKSLRANTPETRLGFDHQTFGLPIDSSSKRKNLYMSAFEFDSVEEYNGMPDIIRDGIQLFKKQFGYEPKAFMAPCAIWSRKIEPILNAGGIKIIQTGPLRYEPYVGAPPNKYKKSLVFHGSTNKQGQIYTMRNCTFEPSESPDKDWVNACLADISKAFFWKRPAIIAPHRVNFIGSLVPGNRDSGLKSLKTLLHEMLKRWPDVEFMTSEELGNLMLDTKLQR